MLWDAVLHCHLYLNPQSLQACSSTWQEDLPAAGKDLADGKCVLDGLALICVIIGVYIKKDQGGPSKTRSSDDRRRAEGQKERTMSQRMQAVSSEHRAA